MKSEETKISSISLLRGIKIAEVVSNEDPKLQERVLVRVLGVHNMKNTDIENAVWAHHCAPTRDGAGDLPEPGDFIYVIFPDVTNPMAIIWLGFARSSFQTPSDGTVVVPVTEIDSRTDHDEDLIPTNIAGL